MAKATTPLPQPPAPEPGAPPADPTPETTPPADPTPETTPPADPTPGTIPPDRLGYRGGSRRTRQRSDAVGAL